VRKTLTSIDLKLKDGIYAASLTPLDENLNIDHIMFTKHIEWLLNNGCNGVLIMGTTGEANSFAVEERIKVLDMLLTGGIPGNQLLVGTGCCAITDTIKLTKHALACGVGGVLMLPPFYYKNIEDDGLYNTFEYVIQKVNNENLRIYLYHFPQNSGLPFSSELIERLIYNFPEQIIGIKDSSGDWNNMKLICGSFPYFKVYAGNEKFLLNNLKIGGAGCISATVNLSCELASSVFSERNNKIAKGLEGKLIRFREVMEKYPMIPALKQIMSEITNNQEWLRLRPPHVPLRKEKVADLLKNLKSINFPEEYISK
jgi:4-hydroxy-tetrahydrodipicolinate synthase